MIWNYEKGNQTHTKEMEKVLSILHAKQPEAELIHIDEETFDKAFLEEILQSQGLFSPKYIIVLNFFPEEYEARMKESEHAFITVSTSKVIKTDYKKDFSMAEKLGERDIVGLWRIFAQSITNEVSPEEIHCMFVWQIKGMLLALKTKTAAEAGMSDFPYTKAKHYAKNYSTNEPEEKLFELITMYDKAHSGRADLKIELERWVLSLSGK